MWIYKLTYLGFELSAFALQNESNAGALDDNFFSKLPRGTLVNLVQKGIQFIKVEAQVAESRGEEGKPNGGDRLAAPYTLVSALSLGDEEERRLAEIKEREGGDEKVERKARKPVEVNKDDNTRENGIEEKELRSQSIVDPVDSTARNLSIAYTLGESQNSQFNPVRSEILAFGTVDGAHIMTFSKNEVRDVPHLESSNDGDIQMIEADSDVPNVDISPSAAATTAITATTTATPVNHIPNTISATSIQLDQPLVSPEDKDTTSLIWDPTGTLLVSGTFDGKIRVWTFDGKLRHVLSLHRAPILNVRFNPSGILIGSIDCTGAIVIWDVNTGDIREYHGEKVANQVVSDTANGATNVNGKFTTADGSGITGSSETTTVPITTADSAFELQNGGGIDWIDDTTYATTGENSSIDVYKVGEPLPLLRFNGHTQNINCLRFDLSTKLLASASDDYTIRIWHGKSPVSITILSGHIGSVLDIKWISSDLTKRKPKSPSLLLSSSTDCTVRIWDVSTGLCVALFKLHKSPIFAVEVNPNSRYVASGSADGVLFVWDIEQVLKLDGTIMPTEPISCPVVGRYQINDSNFESNADTTTVTSISWSADSRYLFVGYGNKSVILEL